MKILIKLKTEKEDTTPEYDEKHNNYAPGFAKAVRQTIKDARKINSRSKWGWCTVVVTATVVVENMKFQGEDVLGCCSYTSELDFVANSCYFHDMMETAISKALTSMRTHDGKKLGLALQAFTK